MLDPLNENPAAREWVNNAIQRRSGGIFGKLVPAVIWSDGRHDDGESVVPIDPVKLVSLVRSNSLILLHNHDPGRPKGQVLEAAYFETDSGERFVAAVLGLYAGGDVLNFRGLDLDTSTSIGPPKSLPALPDGGWIEVATDPKEVDETWLHDVTSDAPLQIKRTELSHNAAESTQELIRIGIVYLALVWNPFVTSIASEAGKAAYAAINLWVRKLLEKLAHRRNPILDIHTHQDSCQISFLFRGKDVKQHYAGHDALPGAAAQAAQLVAKLKARRMPARQLIYEFNVESLTWYPSYAVLNDNRIIADNAALIAIEQLPTGLSLGMGRGKSLSPIVESAPDDDG
jgi:hypothetical protein